MKKDANPKRVNYTLRENYNPNRGVNDEIKIRRFLPPSFQRRSLPIRFLTTSFRADSFIKNQIHHYPLTIQRCNCSVYVVTRVPCVGAQLLYISESDGEIHRTHP